MHKLHTTKAFVLQRYPQGESNYTYKLLTEDLGMLYAHAQSIRELKSRNKYALKIGQLSEVTLVKGREIWRITGAQNISDIYSQELPVFKRKILHLTGKLLPFEVVSPEVFEIVETCFMYECENKETESLVEVVTMLRLMDKLGFVARPISESSIKKFLHDSALSKDVLEEANTQKHKLIHRVNNALEEAK